MISEDTPLAPLTMSLRPAGPGIPLVDLSLGEFLDAAARNNPDRTALVGGTSDPGSRRRWSYADLVDDAKRVGRRLAAEFEPGERIAVWGPGVPEWVLAQFGIAYAGLTLVPLNPAYRPGELAHALRVSGASAMILARQYRGVSLMDTLDSVRDQIQPLRTWCFDEWHEFLDGGDHAGKLPAVDPSSVAQIQFTSGTTGAPKGALFRHRAIVNNARLATDRSGVEEGGVWLNPLPMCFSGGTVFNSLGSVANRATHVIQAAFDPGQALELIESEHVTFLCAVPTMLLAMMDHPDFTRRDISSLQHVLAGGTPIAPEQVRRFESVLGVRYVMVFGQTESGPTVTMTAPDDADVDKAETIGFPLPHTEIKVVDAAGAVVPINETGELRVRSYGTTGYIGVAEDEQPFDEHGWVRTGDLGSMDQRGYLKITGRLKDVIIRGGLNISPREIEDMLAAHPAVSEPVVVGLPHERLGEQVGAWIRLTPGSTTTPEELSSYLAGHLASYKVPSHWEFVDELPRTPSGKVQKFVLRDSFIEHGRAVR